MSEDSLRDYLLKQARSLDSLLELTPAKHLFGEDVSDQWKRKKQTPEQKKAARMAKLDPANWKSAKDVYDERSAKAAKKRKREVEEGYDGEENAPQAQPVKKQKNDEADAVPKQNPMEKLTERLDREDIQNKNLLKKAKKRANQKERKRQKKERKEQAKVQRQSTDNTGSASRRDTKPVTQQDKSLSGGSHKAKSKSNEKLLPTKSNDRRKGQEEKSVSAGGNAAKPKSGADQSQTELEDEDDSDDVWSDTENDEDEDGGHNARNENENDSNEEEEEDDDDDVLSAASFSEAVSDTFSPQDSVASSISSIVPPPQSQSAKLAEEAQIESQKSDKATPRAPIQTDEQRQSARQRLQEQISQFRSQRKADEKPVRSRADLLLQRRQKELEKKAAKKEQRRKEKEEEARRQDEEMAKRFSPGGSGSLLASPRSPMIDDDGSNGFTFGRIAFEDGTQFDPSTGSAAAKKKHKGPADPASALKAVQAKQARLAGLDEQKRQDIAEKDMWLNAKKRAHGERVRDDTSLLKKALKRHEKQKQRSEKEWDERLEGVKSSQEARQKRRAENIQKRKDEKFAKKTGAGKKKVKRPGFEGSFRSRSGKSKK